MKPFAVISMGISILLLTSPAAKSEEPFSLENMICHIASGDKYNCTGTPTLQTGVLSISKQGTFEMKASYAGCFMMENVTKSGKYETSFFDTSMSLELLTTKTKGMKSVISDFPRTLGYANLEYDKLGGYFIDLSSSIYGRGRSAEYNTPLKLQCEVDL